MPINPYENIPENFAVRCNVFGDSALVSGAKKVMIGNEEYHVCSGVIKNDKGRDYIVPVSSVRREDGRVAVSIPTIDGLETIIF